MGNITFKNSQIYKIHMQHLYRESFKSFLRAKENKKNE